MISKLHYSKKHGTCTHICAHLQTVTYKPDGLLCYSISYKAILSLLIKSCYLSAPLVFFFSSHPSHLFEACLIHSTSHLISTQFFPVPHHHVPLCFSIYLSCVCMCCCACQRGVLTCCLDISPPNCAPCAPKKVRTFRSIITIPICFYA